MAALEKALNQPDSDLILITGGDPAGVGPELLVQMAANLAACKFPLLYIFTGSPQQEEQFKSELHAKGGSHHNISLSLALNPETSFEPGNLYILSDFSPIERAAILPGEPSLAAGLLSFEALRLACDVIQAQGTCRGLLTAPVAKEWIARAGQPDFRGHTGYLADRFSSNVLMLMHGLEFSVIPLTIHIPLADVSRELEETIGAENFPSLLQRLQSMPVFKERPWAFCGLNPHAGEGGYLGREELDYIEARLKLWRESGYEVDGPLPADSVFLEENRSHYRLIFGCYHDQVLIPFKALEGRAGINCTVGLPFPRSSPDHGTAYAIAGKNEADRSSMQNAMDILTRGDLLEVKV